MLKLKNHRLLLAIISIIIIFFAVQIFSIKEKGVVNRKKWESSVLNAIEKNQYSRTDKKSIYEIIKNSIKKENLYYFEDQETDKNYIIVESKKNLIKQKIFKDNKIEALLEFVADKDYKNYKLIVTDYKNYKVKIYDNLPEAGIGVIQFKNGDYLEFLHKNGLSYGEATYYFKNGDKEIVQYIREKKVGKATKFYKNGDREEYIYNKDEVKNGESVYYFKNGDKEIVNYVDDILEGKARYVYKDGFSEKYFYKNGKRVE